MVDLQDARGRRRGFQQGGQRIQTGQPPRGCVSMDFHSQQLDDLVDSRRGKPTFDRPKSSVSRTLPMMP